MIERRCFGRRLSVQDTLGSAYAEMQLEGHSSMQAPQLEHLEVSMMATSSQVMAFSGQTSTHAPHATHSDVLIVVI